MKTLIVDNHTIHLNELSGLFPGATIIKKELLADTSLVVEEAHKIGTQKVPQEFRVIASSNHGPEIIRHNNRPIIALQFHPEIHKHQPFIDWLMSQYDEPVQP